MFSRTVIVTIKQRSRIIVLLVACFIISQYVLFSSSVCFDPIKYSRSFAKFNGVSDSTVASLRNSSNLLLVVDTGNLSARVQKFNEFIDALTKQTFAVDLDKPWTFSATQIDVLWGKSDDYIDRLSNYSHVTTVALPWLTTNPTSSTWNSLTDTSNLLIQMYYEWTADDVLCSWIKTPGVTKMMYDAVYNRSCCSNISHTAKPRSLAPVFLNGKPIWPGHYWPNNGTFYPASFYNDPPSFVSYLHIHRNAIVTHNGDVYSGNLKLVLFACSYDLNPALPFSGKTDDIPLYEQVIVIAQFWGDSYFHRMTEIMPRLVLYLDFLKANPHVVIMAPEKDGGLLGEILMMLGFDPGRLVSGIVRAKLVYQPRSSMCGFANVQESQILSKVYRDSIKRSFPSQPRNKLILIRRSGSRKFTEHQAIEQVLRRAAKDYNMTLEIFIDNPAPSLRDTISTFHSAVAIVAPHGAGLSNMLFSEPGTYIIEGVCNTPHVNLCFLRLAHILGHHWHGIPSRGGCESVVDVTANSIELALRQYLDIWSSKQY